MKKLLFVLVLIGVALTAAAFHWASPSTTPNLQGYSFEHVQYGSLTDAVNVSGVVMPQDIEVVFGRTPGTVDEILPEAQVGQRVEKGQPLVRLNSEMAKLSFDRAQAALERAKAKRQAAQEGLDKMKRLESQDLIKTGDVIKAESELNEAKAGVKEAQALLDQAQKAMDWSTINAPVAGIIIKKDVLIGQPAGPIPGSTTSRGSSLLGGSTGASFGVSSGGPLFVIAKDLKNLEIVAQIPQSDFGRVQKNQAVKFTVEDFTETENPEFEGKIERIEFVPTSLQGAVFYQAKILVTNRPRPNFKGKEPNNADDWILSPGMNLSVDIVRRVHSDVWKIPKVALDFQMDNHYITPAARRKLDSREQLKNPNQWTPVWIMDDKTNKPWPIFVRIGGKSAKGETGISDDNYTEVLEWDPDMEVRPVGGNESTYPQVIIGAPPVNQSFFDKMRIRVG
jgi:HlyD family secretion protein